MVLKQAYLGSARSLLFLGGSLPSGSAPHWGAPEIPLPSVPLISLPLPPSWATASGTNSSNTTRIVRVPRPPDLQFLPLCLPSCCFFQTECLYPAPPAMSAWQTPSHLTNPSRSPPPGSPPSSSHAPPPPGYLCCLSMLLLWHLPHCILLVYMFVSPFSTVNPSGHGLYLMHLCIFPPSTVPGTQ